MSGRSEESTTTASTFSPSQARFGVMSKQNGVYPPRYSRRRWPLIHTVAAVSSHLRNLQRHSCLLRRVAAGTADDRRKRTDTTFRRSYATAVSGWCGEGKSVQIQNHQIEAARNHPAPV